MFEASPYRPEVETALLAVTEAGAAVRDLYDRNAAAEYTKGDGSPVTDADLASDRIIRRVLSERHPAPPILTEEGADDEARLAAPRVWIADPIDGTKQFVERTGNFDILLALIEDGRPVVGVSFQPPTGRLCIAVAGFGAWVGEGARIERRVIRPPALPATPAVGTSVWFGAPANLEALARLAGRLGGHPVGASEIGFTPRLFLDPRPFDLLLGFRVDGPHRMAWEWDFAVGDLFLHEAGGRLTDLDGRLFAYNKPRPRVDRGLVASLHPSLHAAALSAVEQELAALAGRSQRPRSGKR